MKKSSAASAAIALAFALLVPIGFAEAKSCTSTPEMTEGPYYLAGMPLRSNITEGLEGIKTTLTFTVQDKNCKVIPNAKVDIWHTNYVGVYSGVEGNSGTYMRGSQITNKNGKVTFTTIFPGWYPARTMHIHAKVWVNDTQVLTTQFFTSDKVTSKVYNTDPYKVRGQQQVNNARDGIYQSLGSNSKLLTLTAKIAPKKISLSGNFVLS